MGKVFILFFLLPLIILLISIGLVIFNVRTPTFHDKNANVNNIEVVLTEKTDILNSDGTLNVRGWSRSPINYNFNKENIKASTTLIPFLNKLRYKKWEFFLITHKDFYLGIGVFDLSYIGGHILHFNDLTRENSEVFTEESLNLFNKPYINDNCWNDCQSSQYKSGIRVKFESRKEINRNSQFIEFSFNDHRLNVTLTSRISCPNCEGIVTTTPISQDTTLFYHNGKFYNMKQSGKLVINGKTYNLADCDIAYDSGRGVWPLFSGWIWMSSSGKTTDGKSIALNIGHGFSHPESSRHTEDAFFIDGKIFKLPSVITREVSEEYPSTKTYWSFESVEHQVIKNRCDFKMEIIKKSNLDQDFILFKSSFDINYGFLKGKCTDEKGNIYKFENIKGFLENKRSIW